MGSNNTPKSLEIRKLRAIWKQKLIEEQERGWDSVDLKFACENCVDDYALKEFVKDNAVPEDCSYCGQSCKDKPLTIAVDDLIEQVAHGLEVEWEDPIDGVIWDSAEGGWQGVDVFDTWDLLSEEIENPFNSDDLFTDVVYAFQREWCQKDFAAFKPEEALLYGWQEFSKTVKHHTRHVFSMAIAEDDESYSQKEFPTPAEFLAQLGEVITEVGLVAMLPEKTQILRGRLHPKLETYSSASALGTTPHPDARFSNRMSPAGIPMFYGALDEKTVRAELYDPLRKGQIVTMGAFVTAQEFAILDFTNLPNIPSLFDETNRHKRPGLKFLYDFVRDLSRPIKKDGREHIEYVPTQVVTEYFRRIFKTNSGANIRGIIYQSSKKCMGKCCVLFFENEDSCNITKGWNQLKGKERKWLGLDTVSIKRVKPFKCAERDQIDWKNLWQAP